MAANIEEPPIKAVDLILRLKEAMSIDRHIMATIYRIEPFSKSDKYKKLSTNKAVEVMENVDDLD